jgi:hypothetical protein
MASDSNLHVETGTADPNEATGTDDRAFDNLVDEAVRCLVGGISERFVPQPSNEQRTIDMIDGMGDFKSACRWKEFWRNRNIERAETGYKILTPYSSAPKCEYFYAKSNAHHLVFCNAEKDFLWGADAPRLNSLRPTLAQRSAQRRRRRR